MQSEEIRKRFLDFFEKRGHVIVPSSSLVPEGDLSVLLTTAGMQQFKPYYTGALDPMTDLHPNTGKPLGSKNAASIQKSFRTSDIAEVGDESHLTFFEMLGNFSFGGYFKEGAIKDAYDFVTQDQEMGLNIDHVSIFAGEDGVPRDEESEKIWRSIDPNIIVKEFGRADNFWGPTGEEGPCGPTTEIYVDGIEIWNIVFNEFYQHKDKTLEPLKMKGIDTGMGLERLALVSRFPGQAGEKTIFETDLFSGLTKLDFISSLTHKKKRILADHSRAVCFLISDGLRPSNKDAGYILRRLLRRLLAQFELEYIKLAVDWCTSRYNKNYRELDRETIWQIVEEERSQFIVALNLGMRELEKLPSIDDEKAFHLYSTYGLPFDVIKDKFPELDLNRFAILFRKHQKLSRAGVEQKFRGGLAGHGEMEVKYHTATHLLHQALHDVLGEGVVQRGSNITPERLRFDFAFPRKLTEEEKRQVEDIVNQKIDENLKVHHITLPKDQAIKTGARHFFDQKYPNEVNVYYIGESLAEAYSKEFCGGPHVDNISVLGKFKITKEEAVSAGVRRIKAVLR